MFLKGMGGWMDEWVDEYYLPFYGGVKGTQARSAKLPKDHMR